MANRKKRREHKVQPPKEKAPVEEATQTLNIKVEWIAVGILFVLFAVSLFTRGFTKLPFNLKLPFVKSEKEETVATADTETLKMDILNLLNQQILQGQATAEITDISDDADGKLFKVNLTVNGNAFESFASKDGQYFYPERYAVKTDTTSDTSTDSQNTTASYPKQDTPEVMVFTMSYCPYGNQADSMAKPVYDLLADKMKFEPHYVIYSSAQGYQGTEYCLNAENKYCSMHGVQELHQDVRELCTWKYQQSKYWDFVLAMNDKCTSANADSCWEQVGKDTGLDTAQIKKCEADEATTLLENEVQLNTQYKATGSPTIVINGQDYSGARTPEDFKKAICSSFNTEPDACSQTLDTTTGTASGSCN
jgi:hypothetical protein